MAGTLVITTLSDGTNSTSATNPIMGSAKAWLNLNNTSGASVIRSSYNVSSVTYSAAGSFIVNFTNAFTDANYCTVTSSGVVGGTSVDGWLGVRLATTTSYNNKTTTACSFFLLLGNNTTTANNFDNNIAFFR
jgi:hypothetical protein